MCEHPSTFLRKQACSFIVYNSYGGSPSRGPIFVDKTRIVLKIELSKGEYEGKTRLFAAFPYDRNVVKAIRDIPGARWSQSKKAWHFHFSESALNSVRASCSRLPEIQLALSENLTFEKALCDPCGRLEKFRLYLRSKRYSENTISTYLQCLHTFFHFFAGKDVANITNDDLIRFNNEYILKNKFSSSFQNQVVNAVKLFYRVVGNRDLAPELIHRPRREKHLPNVLSKEEVKAILEAHSNFKHKMMLSLIYSCGLRSSELTGLRPLNIDSKRHLVLIRQAKGKKDRIVPLSPKILEMLRAYFAIYKPKTYLFEGQFPDSAYDSRSLQLVLKQALKKANISKPVTLHWLRHSYATHLLENGTDLRYIQELLGHSSSRTTEIYTHVTTLSIQKIVSPFDSL